MKITKRILPKSKYKRPGQTYNKTTITIHSTGNNNSTAKNEVDYLHSPTNKTYTSYHYAVGDNVIYQVIPDNEIAYHSGNRTGNRHSIGIEMVHTGNRKKVLDNTLWLIEHLMKKHNIPKKNVVRHHDWIMRENGYSYHKNCPIILNRDGKWTEWKKFHARIGKKASKPKEEKRSVLDTMTEKELKALINKEIEKAIRPNDKQGNSDSHWAAEFRVSSNKVIKDLMSDKKFNNLITRGEVIKMIAYVINHYEKELDKIKMS